MKKILLIVATVVVAVVIWAAITRSAPPDVPFAKVMKETLVSTLVTNGKAEPVEWVAVRAERAGAVEKLLVERGQPVVAGAVIAQLESNDARAALSAAQARIAGVRAEIETLERGGPPGELSTIEANLAQGQFELAKAQREYETLERLQKKNAATTADVNAARDRIEQARTTIRGLESRKASLVAQGDRTAAQARLRDAEAAAELARLRLEQGIVRSPMSGVAYRIETRAGAYVNPGDLIAEVGRIDKLRVTIYVDEPELGRVSQAMPVTITWDAMQGKRWTGTIEKVPTQVVAFGSRQVGEVISAIDNPGSELLPGTNVNAEIRSQMVSDALTIPKEALRRVSGETGVFVLKDNKIEWRVVRLGASSVTRTQIVSGVSEGDSVSLPSDRPLSPGMTVRPVYPGV